MAHYDCTDCGADYGIGYGHCHRCTPKEVFELEEAVKKARLQAHTDFKRDFAEQIRALELAREDYVATKIRDVEAQYQAAYKKGQKK